MKWHPGVLAGRSGCCLLHTLNILNYCVVFKAFVIYNCFFFNGLYKKDQEKRITCFLLRRPLFQDNTKTYLHRVRPAGRRQARLGGVQGVAEPPLGASANGGGPGERRSHWAKGEPPDGTHRQKTCRRNRRVLAGPKDRVYGFRHVRASGRTSRSRNTIRRMLRDGPDGNGSGASLPELVRCDPKNPFGRLIRRIGNGVPNTHFPNRAPPLSDSCISPHEDRPV